MPEDYYGDNEDESRAPTGGDGDHGEESPHDTGKTAVVPSELCPGMKAGDEMVVKILSVDDDSYEITYAPEKGKPKAEKEGAGGEETEPEPEEGSMASMY